MKATASWLGALLIAGAPVSQALAAPPGPGPGPCCPWPLTPDPRYPNIPRAPDMCGPGWYYANCCGVVYGPNYCIYPPFQPFQGLLLGPKPPCPPGQRPNGVTPPGVAPGQAAAYGQPPGHPEYAAPVFPTHPFARSPRDFFMVE